MSFIQSAGITDVGRRRKGNEDSYHLDNDLRLFVVADGMGGHAAGEVASRMVVNAVVKFMAKFHAHPARAELPTSSEDLTPPANLLLNAIHLANRVVHQNAQQNAAYEGMGSTVSAVYLTDDLLIAANVGDSPIYLIQDKSIRMISVLHTMFAEYEDLDPEGGPQLSEHLKHVLTRAMGLREKVTPDVTEISLGGDGIVVICSDGLSDKVSPDEILAVVTRESPDHAGKALVAMANERGGEDNITVIISRITTEAPPIPKSRGDTGSPLRIAVDYDTEEVSNQGYVTQILDDGVFIEASDPIAEGEEISITFSGIGGMSAFLISGRVADRGPKGIEVRFEGLSESQRTRLAMLRKG